MALVAIAFAAAGFALADQLGRRARKRAFKVAEDAIERRFNILEAVADGMYIVDNDLIVTHVNEEAERLVAGCGEVLVRLEVEKIGAHAGRRCPRRSEAREDRRSAAIGTRPRHTPGSQDGHDLRAHVSLPDGGPL